MQDFYKHIQNVDISATQDKHDIMDNLIAEAKKFGYKIVDIDMKKPWGGYVRFDTKDANHFVSNFFPGLDIDKARMGRDDVELSPKFLLVTPAHRLSWQYHDRRAERWRFLSPGSYFRSTTDEQGEPHQVSAGEVVQFGAGERHRLCANVDSVSYTLIAEIWQHTDPAILSTEDDIIRLQDDYKR